jgi:hypothetical protein
VLVVEANGFAELNELYGEFFATDPPARMAMQVPLPRGLLLSGGCVALIESCPLVRFWRPGLGG